MDLGSLLPPLDVTDMIAKRVRVTIDGVEYVLPVKGMRANREWEERLDTELVRLLETVRADGDDVAAVFRALAESPARFIDLLLAYDDHDILPDRDTIEEVETEMGLLIACLEVWRAAHPLVAIGIETVAQMPDPVNVSAGPMSSRSPSGAGPMPTSRKN